MKGSGKGGDPKKNRKKNFKRRGQESGKPQNRSQQAEASKHKGRKAVDFSVFGDAKFARKRNLSVDRPKWIQPKPPALSLPSVACIWCEKPIKDFSTALSDPETGKSVHFDCAIGRIAEREKLRGGLAEGDAIGYIGGGRFGVLHFDNPQNTRKFKIKKVFEWEDKETRSDWRVALCEHFSVT